LFTSTSQVIGWKDWVFAPVKWLVGTVVSKVTYRHRDGICKYLPLYVHRMFMYGPICCVWLCNY